MLHAYKDFQEALEIRNTIAGGLGEAYGKPTSVPQGDPMSMMIISLILRAWVVQMEMCAVIPRMTCSCYVQGIDIVRTSSMGLTRHTST